MPEPTEIDDIEAPPPSETKEPLGELISYYWSIFRRYYWVALLSCLAFGGGAYVYTQYQPEIFQASSKIIYHKSQGNIMGENRVDMMDTGRYWAFERFWKTQQAILESRWFAKRVIKRQGLLDNPDFLSPPTDGEKPDRDEKIQAGIDKIQQVSTITRKRKSRVGIVTVESESAELSASIANGMADAYVEYTDEFQSSGLEQLTSWFDSYVDTKRKELEQAQSKLYEFKRKNNILSFSYENRRNLTANSMEKINKKLVEVRADLAAKESMLEQVEKMSSSGAETKSIAHLAEDEALKDAFQQETNLEKKLGSLRALYGQKHPEVQAVQAQLEVVRENIRARIDRIEAGLQNRARVLRRRRDKLESQLSTLKERIFDLNKLGVEYTQLTDRTENLKEMYDTVLKRSSELNINSLYQPDDIEVLEHATAPDTPIAPVLPLNLAVGLLLGMGAGLASTIVIDSLDTTIKSEKDVNQYLDQPILAMLPRLNNQVLEGLEIIGESAADTVTYTAPKSSFAEGIKTLRTNLTFMSPDSPPQLLLITSPGPGEGKTVASSNIAIAMAQSGLETLLVDTDLRRPRVHRALNRQKEDGLTKVVRGQAGLDSMINGTQVENLSVLTSGEVPPNPSEQLHSETFDDVLDELRNTYDRVIFDSPPLAAVSDALILSQAVDGVLLIVEFGKTRKETLQRSLEQLHGIGAPLLGCVINAISADSTGYGDDYSYYRYSYYGEDEGSDAGGGTEGSPIETPV